MATAEASISKSILVCAGSALFGLLVWVVTIASAPRYSYGAEQDTGSAAFWWVLLGAAVLGGFVFPQYASRIGLALGLPPLALSPWTTPRGDNDGLWILMIPFLVVFVFVLVGAATAAGWARSRIERTRK